MVTIVWGNPFTAKNRRKLIMKKSVWSTYIIWQRVKEAIELYDTPFSFCQTSNDPRQYRVWYQDGHWTIDYGSWSNFIYIYGLPPDYDLFS